MIGERLVTDREESTIPVVAEELTLGKRVLETGGVRVVKTVSEHQETVSEPVVRESASVERVVVNRLLDAGEALPAPRQEGDTLIVPLFEEVVVVETRVRLTEELHIRRTRTEEAAIPETVTLRRESVHIEPILESDV